jgi:hypothetical protein
MHYDRVRKTGSIGPVNPLRPVSYAGATCKISGCEKRATNKGWCDGHYQRFVKHGDPLGGNPSPKVLKAIDHEDGTRTCSECQVRQPLDNFHKDQRATLGRRSKCKTCRIKTTLDWYNDNRDRQVQRQRERFEANIEIARERDRKRYERDREKRIELATQASHKRRLRLLEAEYDRSVTRANLRKQYGDECFYCGCMMDFGRYKRGETPTHLASIEHVVPVFDGGTHTWDNVVLACLTCNLRKNRRTLDAWMASRGLAG